MATSPKWSPSSPKARKPISSIPISYKWSPPSFAYDAYAHHGRNLIQRFDEKLKAAIPITGPGPVLGSIKSMPPSRAHRSADESFIYPVGILGAGPGGLYTALMLEDLGIPYCILEAQGEDRLGGRLFTYTFPNETGAPYNYYDVGAMRFPKTNAMERVFKLFDYPPLNTGDIALRDKLRPYYWAAVDNNAFYSYNDVTIRQNAVPPQDPFKTDEVIQDVDPDPYIAAGRQAITDDVIRKFAIGLLDDLQTGGSNGWEEMKRFDHYSTRAYMSIEYIPDPTLNLPPNPLPTDVVNWCETFDASTGYYDRALSDYVLEAIAFGWQPDGQAPPTEWFCIDGGAQEIAKSMAQYIRRDDPDIIKLNSKVTSIALREDVPQEDVPYIEVVTNTTEHHKFSHVISTLPLPALRIVDLSRAGLTPMQSNAMRHLTYDSSIKIGLQFETAWWTTAIDLDGTPLNIIGGQTYTDTPLRTVVYPSFGDVHAGKTTTLIASYCWTDDAQRLGGMIGKDDETLKELALRELAKIHNLDVVFLRRQLLGYMAWNWTQDPYTMGAFAFFGPGKFGNLYTRLNSAAADGFLHFAGEALSVRHAWVEGALDSAWRAVEEMLQFPAFQEYQDLFHRNWGVNPEWTTPPDEDSDPDVILAPKNNLVLEHLALTHPDLF